MTWVSVTSLLTFVSRSLQALRITDTKGPLCYFIRVFSTLLGSRNGVAEVHVLLGHDARRWVIGSRRFETT
jgi:hypothetical protein